jgi:hypothetical protein
VRILLPRTVFVWTSFRLVVFAIAAVRPVYHRLFVVVDSYQWQANCDVPAPNLNYSFGNFYNSSRCQDVPLFVVTVRNYVAIYAYHPNVGACCLQRLQVYPSVMRDCDPYLLCAQTRRGPFS